TPRKTWWRTSRTLVGITPATTVAHTATTGTGAEPQTGFLGGPTLPRVTRLLLLGFGRLDRQRRIKRQAVEGDKPVEGLEQHHRREVVRAALVGQELSQLTFVVGIKRDGQRDRRPKEVRHEETRAGVA